MVKRINFGCSHFYTGIDTSKIDIWPKISPGRSGADTCGNPIVCRCGVADVEIEEILLVLI